jgi:alginate O-acetyltransferase complex protein AlgJ
VRVLDLVPEFLAHRSGPQGPLYCKQDTHWSGRACVLTARRLAAMVRERPWFKSASTGTQKLSSEWRSIEIIGDLWQALKENRLPRERIPLRFVGIPSSNGLVSVMPESNRPIVLLGDSHNLVFHTGSDMHARGAGLPDQLALELGVPVDLVAVRGSGATPARAALRRRALSVADYLPRKKLVIWCFGAREFTESPGWQKVPVIR